MKYDDVIKELKRPIKHEFLGKEADFEETVIEHLPDLFQGLGIEKPIKINQQHVLQASDMKVIFDLFVQSDDGTLNVIEIKSPNKKHPGTSATEQTKAIGQLLLYETMVEARYGVKPRLMLIDNKIHFRTYCAFSGSKIPITLVELQKDRVFVPYRAW